MLWSWQWALAEKVCPDLLPKAPTADPRPRPDLKERKPASIRRLEKRREELRKDLARFTGLLRMHATEGIQALPAKQKWKQLGDKYRAKTPAMWDQWRYNLREELATVAAQLKQWTTRRARRQDSAGLAHGAKENMLKQTAPAVEVQVSVEEIPHRSEMW